MADYRIQRLSRLQAITARNMHQAQRETAHATLHSECDVTTLVTLLGQGADGLAFPLSTYVIYALVQTLKEHPALNAHLAIDELCIYERIKLGLMVPTELGVMMACIADAGAMNLHTLDAALHGLYKRARTGRFELSETRGATFMVADLSAYPVDAFTPILLPSAIAILGIGRTRAVCLPTAAKCRPAHLLALSLTFDHRGTDGLATARFLKDIAGRLEQPEG